LRGVEPHTFGSTGLLLTATTPLLKDDYITAVKSLQFTAFSMELPPATVIEPIRFRFIQVLKE